MSAMIYAILSDLHANESALRRALDDARAAGAEEFVCLGDVVGYGPLPAETLRLVRENCAIAVAGNHDDAVSGRMSAENFIDLAGEAVERHRRALPKSDLQWLAGLPYVAELEGAVAVHGDLVDAPAFYYVDDESAAAENFARMPGAFLFCGHTHVPLVHAMSPDGGIATLPADGFTAEPGFRYVVNPGSVGYPREADGRCESTYVLYDSSAGTVRYRRLPFSVSSVMQRGAVRPRSANLRLVAALVGLAVLAGAAAVAFHRRGTPAAAAAASAASEVVEAHDVHVPANHGKLTANLQLAGGSAAANLRITFFAADGSRLKLSEFQVQRSSKKDFDVPQNATDARLELLRLPGEDSPSARYFKPYTH